MNFQTYPFEKLNDLLDGITPNENYEPISLTIGEPQFQTPDFIQKELCDTSDLLKKYPASLGESTTKEAMINFVNRRFGVQLNNDELIPSFGTREVLFNFPQFFLFDKSSPKMAFTNPFYQIYEGSAIASRSQVVYINLTKENNFKPNISEEKLKDCHLVIINFPNNPTASNLSIKELEEWVKLALKHDFVLLNDECYSEIYTNESNSPHSLLEASVNVGNSEFKNILVINSISKRSNAPGLRSGFIAGDSSILKEYSRYRTYLGTAVPLPLQRASVVAYNDEEHVKDSRKIYQENFQIAKDILDIEIPEATFYIWLEVGDELEFTKNLYKEYNIKVLPGSFLGRDGQGKGFVRLALVYDNETTKECLVKIKEFMSLN
jgi:aspartate/methionine/tyrosine aminotransferase